MTPQEALNDIARGYEYSDWEEMVMLLRPDSPLIPPRIIEAMEHYASFKVEEKINKPQFINFIEAVKVEMAHHEQKWGDESQVPPHHFNMVLTYLLGKLAKSVWDIDRVKFEHHLITLGAVAGTTHKYLFQSSEVQKWFNGK